VRAALAIALATTIAFVYSGPIAGLWREWTSSPDASYGLLLTGVAIASIWARREALSRAWTVRVKPYTTDETVRLKPDTTYVASPYVASGFSPTSYVASGFSQTSWSGFAVLALGLLIYLVGQLGADVFLTRVSLVIVIAGAIWFAGGEAAVRTIAAPLLFLLIAVPLPALVVNAVTLPMQLTASRIAEHTLSAGGLSVFRDGNVLELPSASLEVAEACSGLRSAISLAAVGVLLASAQPTWPRRAAVVLAAFPIAIIVNGLRIAATAVATETWGPDVATGAWHTFGGWITFIVSVAMLIGLQRAIADRGRRDLGWRRQAVSA